MTSLIIHGIEGAMGQKVLELSQGFNVAWGVDLSPKKNYPFPTTDDIFKASGDVLIDFSSPKALPKLLEFGVSTGTALVLCSTGFSSSEKELIFKASEKVAIFFSYNMSLGINLLSHLAKKATEVLEGFDIEIVETHHNRKMDAPSGTALMLKDSILEKRKLEPVFGREGKTSKREKNEIGIHAVRGGTVVGKHEIHFFGNDEEITLSHQASSRDVFAKGALVAAKFLAGKTAGLYDMYSLLSHLI